MTINQLIERDLAVLWHPCSQMSDYADLPPLPVVGASGCRLLLDDGREILDGVSSWWCKSLGHGHPAVVAAIHHQLTRFEHVILANTTNEPIVALCERLLAAANAVPKGAPSPSDGAGADGRWRHTIGAADAATLPPAQPAEVSPDKARGVGPEGRRGSAPLTKVFFADNGSTGIEVALKLALHVQHLRGRPARTGYAVLAGGYHGETVGALSVSDLGLYADPYRPLLFPALRLDAVPWRSGPEDPRWLDVSAEWPALEAQLTPQAAHLAAIIYEPVLQGAGGMRPVSPALLPRLRAWADAHDVLLIADEIAAGMGRCGAILASHLAGALPDLAVLSKGLSGGSLPLCCVLATEAIYEQCLGTWASKRAFLHSNTYAGNALAVAAANAVLEVYQREDICGQAQRTGERMRASLREAARTRPWLAGVRGVGMAAAADLRSHDGAPLDPALRTGRRVLREALTRGALLRPLGDTMYLFPPLNAPWNEVERMLGILIASADAVVGKH